MLKSTTPQAVPSNLYKGTYNLTYFNPVYCLRLLQTNFLCRNLLTCWYVWLWVFYFCLTQTSNQHSAFLLNKIEDVAVVTPFMISAQDIIHTKKRHHKHIKSIFWGHEAVSAPLLQCYNIFEADGEKYTLSSIYN